MGSIIDCCYKCTVDRYPGCHDHCKRYKEQRARHDKRKAELKAEREINDYICHSQAKRKNKHLIAKKNNRGYNGFHK